ncbi:MULTISPECIES: response regulator [unclassified Frankia]|uniref:response regulator n=1 Tax=unclassified Frankia TaxID=2632575 RepID=UPI00202527BE
MDPVRVFLLDDHEIVRRGIREVLEDTGEIRVVGEASSATEALRRIPASNPQVALLDARLEDGSGIDVCRDIRSAHPEIGCLILTSYDDDDALFASIMAGAAGYLLKQIKGTDLVGAIHTIASGRSLLDPAVTQKVLARLREGPAEDGRLVTLSDREREILLLIAEGLTNRQIASRVHLSDKTVKNYVSAILDKLELTSRTQAAVYATKLQGQQKEQQQAVQKKAAQK